MSRYIDADALIESIKNTADLGGWIGEALYQIKQVAIKYIDSAPSIDIVRCGECKYWENFECQCDWASTDHEGGASYSLDRDADDFCSYGDKRDD